MTSFIVGRGEQADVRLSHDTVSRLHLRITTLSAAEYLVEDLGSANGTWVMRGEQRLPVSSERLTPADQLVLGDYPVTLAVLLELSGQSSQQAPRPRNDDSNTRDPFSRYVRSEDGRYVRKPK